MPLIQLKFVTRISLPVTQLIDAIRTVYHIDVIKTKYDKPPLEDNRLFKIDRTRFPIEVTLDPIEKQEEEALSKFKLEKILPGCSELYCDKCQKRKINLLGAIVKDFQRRGYISGNIKKIGITP